MSRRRTSYRRSRLGINRTRYRWKKPRSRSTRATVTRPCFVYTSWSNDSTGACHDRRTHVDCTAPILSWGRVYGHVVLAVKTVQERYDSFTCGLNVSAWQVVSVGVSVSVVVHWLCLSLTLTDIQWTTLRWPQRFASHCAHQSTSSEQWLMWETQTTQTLSLTANHKTTLCPKKYHHFVSLTPWHT